LPIGERVTLSYRTGVLERRDAGLTATVGGQVAVRVSDLLQWTTSAFRASSERQPVQWELISTLSLTVERDSAYVSGRVTQDAESAEIGASRSLPQGEGFGYRVLGRLAEESSAEGALHYQANFGRYSATYRRFGDDGELGLDAAGAIVVVPGAGIFATLPVQGAYGLIRTPGVQGVRGYGNHQERGRTDASGNLIVPNLISYYGNHLSIAPEDVPIEYELDTTSMTLAPPPRGVALAEFKARTVHYYRGRVVIDQGGTRVTPTYGQLTIYRVGDDVVSPLGEGGEFDLEGADPGTRNALIEWSEGSCNMQIELPPSEDPVIELGELVCRLARADE
jgi:outer membrane usher protein